MLTMKLTKRIVIAGIAGPGLSLLLLSSLYLLIPHPASARDCRKSPQLSQARQTMVRDQIKNRGVSDQNVLRAMENVPRHCFVSETLVSKAYEDHPLPIGQGQTISQPYIVGLMTEYLELNDSKTVLEIGTGSGYHAAVLAQIAGEVYSMEIKKQLYERTKKLMTAMDYKNLFLRHGDGYFGWPEKGPFDGIIITAAVDHIPPPLLKQLKDGGRLILPLGNPFSYQNLVLVTRKGQDYSVRQITGVLFVPMTGRALGK